MNTVRRSAPRTLARPQQPLARTTQRRSASDSHHPSPAQVGPETESFGRGFYIAVAAIPTAYIVYSLSRGDKSNGYIQKSKEYWTGTHEKLVERNALHTRMVEKAGHDRNLFLNSASTTAWPELKFPEHIHGGSPYNVPAGHYANLDQLIAQNREKLNKEEEEKRQLMREGKLPVQMYAKKDADLAAAELTALGEAGGKGA